MAPHISSLDRNEHLRAAINLQLREIEFATLRRYEIDEDEEPEEDDEEETEENEEYGSSELAVWAEQLHDWSKETSSILNRDPRKSNDRPTTAKLIKDSIVHVEPPVLHVKQEELSSSGKRSANIAFDETENDRLETIAAKRVAQATPIPDHASSVDKANATVSRTACIACSALAEFRPLVPLKCCQAHYCKPCLNRWFQTCGEEKKIPNCCGNSVDTSSFLDELSIVARKQYEKLVEELNSAQPLYCADSSCVYFIPSTKIVDGSGTCGMCKKKTCVNCKHLARDHKGDRKHRICPECFQDEQVTEMIKRNALKRCPKCLVIVEKSEGCNNMRCRCGILFCYRCGVKKASERSGCVCSSAPAEELREPILAQTEQSADDHQDYLLDEPEPVVSQLSLPEQRHARISSIFRRRKRDRKYARALQRSNALAGPNLSQSESLGSALAGPNLSQSKSLGSPTLSSLARGIHNPPDLSYAST